MKVSIVSPDLSHNCLGRAFVLAQLIEKNHKVEIIGPQSTDEIWGPLRNKYKYKGIQTTSRLDQYGRSLPGLLDLITGDVIYASKPRIKSYGTSLIKAFGSNRPLILDIDDWESGLNYAHSRFKSYLRGAIDLGYTSSIYYTNLMEKMSSFADARTVSNYFLQDKFGGVMIPHARNVERFDPNKYNKYDIRNELNLPMNGFIVMFSGTPKPHKGLEDLAEALSHISEPRIKGVIVGASKSKYIEQVKEIGGDSLLIRGRQPFDELPKWIAASDVISIPQRDTPQAYGQVPAKVFDAMAMAKPIIATNVSDLPYILNNCGIIVPPGNSELIQKAIITLFSDELLRDELGQSARRKCEKEYSYHALAPKINEVLESAVLNSDP